MTTVAIRFTTQHGDYDTRYRPILYVEGLNGGWVADGDIGETAEAYAERLVRDGLPEHVIEALSAAGLLGAVRPVGIMAEYVPDGQQ